MWQHVISHFQQFLGELELLPTERQDAEGKAFRVANVLFNHYYPDSVILNFNSYQIVGSYGKNCAARPRTDIDMIFVLPPEDLLRINEITWNKQSYLLQEVKRILLDQWKDTEIRGDGPVVKIPFSTYEVELVPCFHVENGLYLNAHTKDGGRWALSKPNAELAHLNQVDAISKGAARHLIKMLKAWKQECNVEMRSVCLEIGAVVFLEQWEYKDKGIGFYGWMARDFFAFLLKYVNGRAKPAGIEEWIPLGDCWQTKCQSAYDRACKACTYEGDDNALLAVAEWQKIFGGQFKYDSGLAKILAGLNL